MTNYHCFLRFLTWLNLHDYFMHSSVSFNTLLPHLSIQNVMVSSYWLLTFGANLNSSASACTLKRWGHHLQLFCDGLGNKDVILVSCNMRAWERPHNLPRTESDCCPHRGYKCALYQLPHIPKWTTAVADCAPHIEHGFSTFYERTIQHSTVGWYVGWVYCMCWNSCMFQHIETKNGNLSGHHPRKMSTLATMEPWKCRN